MTCIKLHPSAAHRWLECPLSAYLASVHDLQGEPSEDAVIGRKAHEVFEQTLLGHSCRGFDPIMRYHASQAALWARRLRDLVCPGAELMPEKRFSLVTGTYSNNGRVDCFSCDGRGVLIFDYKYGRNFVEARDNQQLLNYLYLADRAHSFNSATLAIYQPHCLPSVSFQYMSGDDLTGCLIDFETKLLHSTNYYNGSKNKIPRKAGDHCKYCPSTSRCPEIGKELDRASTHLARLPRSIADLSGPDLGALLDSRERVDEIFKAAFKEANTRLQRGQEVPGYKLVARLGNRAWKDASRLKKTFGESILKPPEIMSPAQVEKARIMSPEQLNALCHREERGVVVVPVSDRRREHAPALEDFGPVDS